jgi:hypothetical protein
MRDIKFRQWRPESKSWHYFGFIDGICSGVISATLSVYPIMQFTGLHDKNGKEIYFDDFVKAPSDNIFQVIWYDEEMRIALKHKDTIYNFNVGLYEVIGNIYENPELIKVK